MFYKIFKTSSTSIAKIVERKLEVLFIRRKNLVFKRLKKIEEMRQRKVHIGGELATTVQRILDKKNHVYTIFYVLKNKRQDIRRP